MRIRTALAIVGLCVFGLVGTAWAATDEEISEECVECHDEEDLPDWSKSAHAVATDARAPTCVSCHGPSPKHIDPPEDADGRPSPDWVFSADGGSLPIDRSAVCMSCHDKDPVRAFWGGSEHHNADVACTACHDIHVNKDTVLDKRMQAETCYTCHKTQRVQVNRPSRHPIPELKMTCSDCHNVHGSVGPKLVNRDSTNDTCYTCHAEKRGPFVHQHEPVVEDCAYCHNPHGSTLPAMLTARPPILCQQCHTPHVAGGIGALGGQPGVFSPAAPGFGPQIDSVSSGKNVVTMWQARSCMNCHTQVHGSNNPSATNPTPQLMFR
ncbi:MAG: DmsE family decaheme c-type cytochrome [Burkholderiales bacterium]|nr:MAG: DmsE family decaheme c-type cytochrome [Burkholderiales bacterium]